MNGQILWGVGLTIILSNTVTKHTIKSLPYLILKRIEFWLTVNFQVQVKILLCRRTNQCILLILKEGSGTWNWPVTTAVHNCLVVKYPRTDEPGLGEWKEEGNATCCQVPAGAFRGATVPRPPRVTALVNHHLCKVGIFKWQPRYSRKGIPGILLLKIPTTFHNQWEFWTNSLLDTQKYWVLREGTTEVFCTPVYTDSDSW